MGERQPKNFSDVVTAIAICASLDASAPRQKKLQTLGQLDIRVSKMHVHNRGMDWSELTSRIRTEKQGHFRS
jgi:hypothetical protein